MFKQVCCAVILGLAGANAMSQAEIFVRFEPGCEGVRGFFRGPVGAVSTTWDFGDGTTSTDSDPVHTFAFNQPISISLLATDAFGEQQTYTAIYPPREQADLSLLEMPTIFTPNGDGANDQFGPIGVPVLGPCADLMVFNRYGQRIFTSQGNNILWDGRSYAGEPAVPGVYFYVLQVGGLEFTGNVTLAR